MTLSAKFNDPLECLREAVSVCFSDTSISDDEQDSRGNSSLGEHFSESGE
jgi:hypothetical protein